METLEIDVQDERKFVTHHNFIGITLIIISIGTFLLLLMSPGDTEAQGWGAGVMVGISYFFFAIGILALTISNAIHHFLNDRNQALMNIVVWMVLIFALYIFL